MRLYVELYIFRLFYTHFSHLIHWNSGTRIKSLNHYSVDTYEHGSLKIRDKNNKNFYKSMAILHIVRYNKSYILSFNYY